MSFPKVRIIKTSSEQQSSAHHSILNFQVHRFFNIIARYEYSKRQAISISYVTQRTVIGPSLRVIHPPCSLSKIWISSRSHLAACPKPLISDKKQSKKCKIYKARRLFSFGLCLFLPLIFYWNVEKYSGSQPRESIFDPPRFTPFEIIEKEEISSTAFILTVRCPETLPDHLHVDPYKQWWEKGIWSVEAKQPELQIARSYTPLPPRPGEPKDYLRFLIRQEYHGEMSTYLHRLSIGSTIYLRGPHLEYEIPEKIGQVVFFAGGTGIAPALQIAYELLERKNGKGTQDVTIHIIWANRRQEDCQHEARNTLKRDTPSSNNQVKVNLNSLTLDLERLQQNYSGQFTIQYFVDEENTILTPKIISKFLNKIINSRNYKSRSGSTSSLLLVSGPEGFINFIAGPKEWVDNKHAQGGLGGALKNINLANWDIWKL